MSQAANGALNGSAHKASIDHDVIIIGAGISGINTAYRVQTQAPKGTTYTILEGRSKIGGTWDLFKYPGIRSDSDLYTFGFPWKPWTAGPSIAEAPLILKYLKDAVREQGIDKNIKFNHKVVKADWSSKDAIWTVEVDVDGDLRKIKGRFLIFGTGYYDYETPLQTVIPGLENFKGEVVHPQFWPEDLNYTNKEVAIIGSGATAVTILPVMAKTAKRTTMIQRSPSYILGVPNGVTPIHRFMSWISPTLAYKMTRARFLVIAYAMFYFARAFPNAARGFVRFLTTKSLPANIPHDPHFNPTYNPWEQRLCLCPDGDFYKALRDGKGNVVTGHIKTMNKNSIVMENGEEVHADILITATGLKLKFGGGINLSIDGKQYNIPTKYMWKGMMLQDLPNAANILGYTNASWTLGADATAQTVTRLMNEMHKKGARAVIPRVESPEKLHPLPALNLNSTYIKKGADALPRVGDSGPWKPRSNYFTDIRNAKWGNLTEGLEYVK